MDLNPFALLLAALAHAAPLLAPPAAVLLAVAVLRGLLHRRDARRARTAARYVRIAAPPEVDPEGNANLWRSLGTIQRTAWRAWWLGPTRLIWEYRWRGARMDLRIWVPGTVAVGRVVHAVQSAWPGAHATAEDAQAPFPDGSTGKGGHLRWEPTPAPVLLDAGADALRHLIEAGPTATEQLTAVVQVVAAPATRRQVRRLRRSAEGPNAAPTLLGELASFIRPRPATPVRESDWAKEQRQALRKRLADQCWNTGIRWAAAGTGDTAAATAEAHAVELGAAVATVTGAGHRRRRLPRAVTACNAWAGAHRTQVLNAVELGQLAHLPSDAIVPSLERAGARPVRPAPATPTGGRHTKTLGTDINGKRVALPAADARYHLHVIGKTGSGKSTLLQHLALADIRDRRGLVLIDPAGDLVDDLLERLDPDDVADRLYLIDPRMDLQPGIDPLAGPDPHLVADNLGAICRQIWPRWWGPRADDILRYAILTLRERNQPLTMLPNLLLSEKFRRKMVAEIQKISPTELPKSGKLEDGDMTGIPGYWAWYGAMNESTRTQAAGPVLTRFRAIVGRPFVRDLFGAPSASFDLARVLDTGGIVLARLSQGEIGEDTSKMIGSILVSRTWQAVSARSRLPAAQRRDCSLIVDEAQDYLDGSSKLGTILPAARKFGLSVTISHQYPAQMDREMQFAVSGQTRTKIYFNSSPEDARLLARHTAPLTEHDLSHLKDYTAAARLFTDREELPAFTLHTLPPAAVVGRAEEIRTRVADRLRTTGRASDAPAEDTDENEGDRVSGTAPQRPVRVAAPPGYFTTQLRTHLARRRSAHADARRDDTSSGSSAPKSDGAR